MNQNSIDDLGFMISDLKSSASNHKSEIRNHKFPRRRGITLMEVLISAGVTAVGLFGVIAVVPVAGIQVQRSITEDRKALLCKNGYAEFRVRQMSRPDAWLGFDTVSGNFVPPYNPAVLQSFCIDPRFVATNPGTPVFPYTGFGNASIVSMSRITLRSSLPAGGTMSLALADDIFMSQDDLSYHIPERGDPAPFTGSWRTEPPIQLLTNGNTKRQSVGDFSWFAMLVPKHGMLNDEYVLSVVALHKRDTTMAVNNATAGMTAKQVANVNERTFGVSLNSGGVNGGEVTLQDPLREKLEGIYQNNWIMLAANTNSGSADFKWYRIIGVDEVLNSNPPPNNVSSLSSPGPGPYFRRVTLQGADWSRPEWFSGTPTQATIMSGVVGVVERTIKLETSSLWTQ